MTIIYSVDMSVYMIRSKDLSLHDFYIGSCEDMGVRRRLHKSNCNNESSARYNIKLYQFIRANGGWNNFEMIKLASVWKKATKPLFQIEQDYIDSYKTTLNSYRAYRSEEYKKEYKKRNINRWRENNREYVKEYEKEYRERNRDMILERAKEYYQNNKDIINEKKNEKFNCECGGKYTRRGEARHLRTNKHKSFIENKE